MNTFIYNNVSSRSFHCLISGEDTFEKPAPDIEHIQVPGRNGDLILPGKRFPNVDITYHCIIKKNFVANYQELSEHLLKDQGYHRLEDTIHPGCYRMAVFASGISPSMLALNKHGTFDLTFSCKPQQYLVEGESSIDLTASGYVTNPTKFDAKPLIRVYGYGELNVGGRVVHINSHSYAYIDLDCELEEAYCGNANCNSLVVLRTNNAFPVLVPNSNYVGFGTGITKVEVTPRWWTI